jgi:hypothetical protein
MVSATQVQGAGGAQKQMGIGESMPTAVLPATTERQTQGL